MDASEVTARLVHTLLAITTGGVRLTIERCTRESGHLERALLWDGRQHVV